MCTKIPRLDSLPSLPHLLPHRDYTIEQFFSECNRGELLLISSLINYEKSVGDLPRRRPSYDQLCLPPKSANLLDFLDNRSVNTSKTEGEGANLYICNSNRKNRVQLNAGLVAVVVRYACPFFPPNRQGNSIGPDSYSLPPDLRTPRRFLACSTPAAAFSLSVPRMVSTPPFVAVLMAPMMWRPCCFFEGLASLPVVVVVPSELMAAAISSSGTSSTYVSLPFGKLRNTH
jgi:hypothetical protein